MKIVCVSDSHNQHLDLVVPDGDVFVHAGDSTSKGSVAEILSFITWVQGLPHKHKIIISGNHDFGFEEQSSFYKKMCEDRGVVYLEDSGVTIDGINFWGSPVQPYFFNWAFNRSINEAQKNYCKKPLIKPHWDAIPENTDILITHGPPYEILDKTKEGNIVGCPVLKERLTELNVKAHIFGHIHEASGVHVTPKTVYVNASVLNRRYQMAFPPRVLEINNVTKEIEVR